MPAPVIPRGPCALPLPSLQHRPRRLLGIPTTHFHFTLRMKVPHCAEGAWGSTPSSARSRPEREASKALARAPGRRPSVLGACVACREGDRQSGLQVLVAAGSASVPRPACSPRRAPFPEAPACRGWGCRAAGQSDLGPLATAAPVAIPSLKRHVPVGRAAQVPKSQGLGPHAQHRARPRTLLPGTTLPLTAGSTHIVPTTHPASARRAQDQVSRWLGLPPPPTPAPPSDSHMALNSQPDLKIPEA